MSDPSPPPRAFDAGAGGAGPRGRLQIEHRLERLELDLDQLGAVLGERLALGDHDRDRLAGVDDLLARQRLVRAARARSHDREIRCGQHRDDARQRQGGVGANARDHRVRLVRQHEPGVQQPRDRLSAAKRVVPRTFGSESRRGVETPIAVIRTP